MHTPEGSYSPRRHAYSARSALPVYERQLFPERVLGEGGATPEKSGETLAILLQGSHRVSSEDVRINRIRTPI